MLNYDSVEEYIKKLKEIGWDLTPKTIILRGKELRVNLEDKIKEEFIINPKFAHKGLSVLSFRKDCVQHLGMYKILINLFSKASNGKFNPTKIRVLEDDYYFELEISFNLNNKNYYKELTFGEYFDDEFLDFINTCLKNINEPKQFIKLPENEEVINFVFVEREVYDKAVKEGLILNK